MFTKKFLVLQQLSTEAHQRSLLAHVFCFGCARTLIFMVLRRRSHGNCCLFICFSHWTADKGASINCLQRKSPRNKPLSLNGSNVLFLKAFQRRRHVFNSGGVVQSSACMPRSTSLTGACTTEAEACCSWSHRLPLPCGLWAGLTRLWFTAHRIYNWLMISHRSE